MENSIKVVQFEGRALLGVEDIFAITEQDVLNNLRSTFIYLVEES